MQTQSYFWNQITESGITIDNIESRLIELINNDCKKEDLKEIKNAANYFYKNGSMNWDVWNWYCGTPFEVLVECYHF